MFADRNNIYGSIFGKTWASRKRIRNLKNVRVSIKCSGSIMVWGCTADSGIGWMDGCRYESNCLLEGPGTIGGM